MRKKRLSVWILVVVFCAVFSITSVTSSNACLSEDLQDDIAAFIDGVEDIWDLLDLPRLPWDQKDYIGSIDDEIFEITGLSKTGTEIWEDGLRTDVSIKSFEWWYADINTADGYSIVVVFYTKPVGYDESPVAIPTVQVTIVTPEGEILQGYQFASPDQASFDETKSNAQIGNSVFRDIADEADANRTYLIQTEDIVTATGDTVSVDLTLASQLPMFRPGTGIAFYGSYERYLGWLVGVPSGVATGTLTINGEEIAVLGQGYHDHNFGENCFLTDTARYWWWGRFQVGPYCMIISALRVRNEYDQKWAPRIFYIGNTETGETVLGFESLTEANHRVSNYGVHPDENFPNGLIPQTIQISLEKENGNTALLTLNPAEPVWLAESTDLLASENLSDDELEFMHLIGYRPWYSRFTMAARLELNIDGETIVVDSGTDTAGMLELFDTRGVHLLLEGKKTW